jgi:hypothetical protein
VNNRVLQTLLLMAKKSLLLLGDEAGVLPDVVILKEETLSMLSFSFK